MLEGRLRLLLHTSESLSLAAREPMRGDGVSELVRDPMYLLRLDQRLCEPLVHKLMHNDLFAALTVVMARVHCGKLNVSLELYETVVGGYCSPLARWRDCRDRAAPKCADPLRLLDDCLDRLRWPDSALIERLRRSDPRLGLLREPRHHA
ncbi:hypothetical protein F6B41_23765 [Microbacterium lushaniae]|nr:hypothetical protein F6B41_23765 [Microbacterium lushaniae]